MTSKLERELRLLADYLNLSFWCHCRLALDYNGGEAPALDSVIALTSFTKSPGWNWKEPGGKSDISALSPGFTLAASDVVTLTIAMPASSMAANSFVLTLFWGLRRSGPESSRSLELVYTFSSTVFDCTIDCEIRIVTPFPSVTWETLFGSDCCCCCCPAKLDLAATESSGVKIFGDLVGCLHLWHVVVGPHSSGGMLTTWKFTSAAFGVTSSWDSGCTHPFESCMAFIMSAAWVPILLLFRLAGGLITSANNIRSVVVVEAGAGGEGISGRWRFTILTSEHRLSAALSEPSNGSVISDMLIRQTGQVVCFSNQAPTQSVWKMWPQNGNCRSTSHSSYSTKQIGHLLAENQSSIRDFFTFF